MKLNQDVILGIIGASILLFLLIPLIPYYRRRFNQTGTPFTLTSYFLIKSLSLSDLFLMSLSNDDRTEFIKNFYDFKHENISTLIKGISSIILLNLGIIFNNYFESKGNDVIHNKYDYILILLTFVLIVINIRYFLKLNECVREFNKAVKFYDLIKSL